MISTSQYDILGCKKIAWISLTEEDLSKILFSLSNEDKQLKEYLQQAGKNVFKW
jgi:hypothetical protein